MALTVATWNINSVRLREGLVARLLREEAPDVLCLQECKSPAEKVPVAAFAELGYPHVVIRGQKGYNGVAVFSKRPLEDAGSVDFAGLGHARHVAARLPCGAVVHNVYVPAGATCRTGTRTPSSARSSISSRICGTTSGPTGRGGRSWWATSTSRRRSTTSGTISRCSRW
jgi:exodeoxyribonuclease-3